MKLLTKLRIYGNTVGLASTSILLALFITYHTNYHNVWNDFNHFVVVPLLAFGLFCQGFDFFSKFRRLQNILKEIDEIRILMECEKNHKELSTVRDFRYCPYCGNKLQQ